MSSLPRRIIVLGDSNACGPYDDVGEPDARRAWPYQLQQLTDKTVINLSAPGNRISQGQVPTASAYSNAETLNFMRGVDCYQIAIVQAGTNDFQAADVRVYTATPTQPRHFHIDYRFLLSYLQSNKVRTLCIPPLWRGDEATSYPHPDGAWPLQTWRSWISDFAAQYGASYLSHSAFGLTPADFVADQILLNADGCDKLAAGINAKLIALGWV
jgi:hypothetical protein